MKERVIISIVKSLIVAIVPTAMRLSLEKPKPKPIEQMVDNIDWDAEYEQLLKEENKQRKPKKWKVRK